jgi:predicted ArsR family transcriptional regulator
MSRPALRPRILGALALRPMTTGQLAQCLSVHRRTSLRAVNELHAEGLLASAGGTVRTKGRPWVLHGLATTTTTHPGETA